MPLFSVFHHDNEVALFSAECTTGALNTALMELASGGGSAGNALQPLAGAPSTPALGSSSPSPGIGSGGSDGGSARKDNPPSVSLGGTLPPREGGAAGEGNTSPVSRASSARSKRMNQAANLAASLLEPPTMILNPGPSAGDITPGGNGGGFLVSASSSCITAAPNNSSGNFPNSATHCPPQPFPVYNYHKLELLPLSFVLDLVNNPKVLTALQAAVTQREQLQQALLLAAECGSPSPSPNRSAAASPAASPAASSPTGAGSKQSMTPVNNANAAAAAAVVAASSNANNPQLSALLHNIPFVGLMTMPVHNSILEMCPPNGQYVLLGCREKTRSSKSRRHHKGGADEALPPIRVPQSIGGVQLPPSLSTAAYTQQLFPNQASTSAADDDLDGPSALFQPAEGDLPPDAARRGNKPPKALRMDLKNPTGEPNANASAPNFAAPTRRPPVLHSQPVVPPPPSPSEVMELVQRAKRVARRTFQRGPLQALGIPPPEGSGPPALGAGGKEKEKGHGKHSASAEDAGPHFGPRRLLTTELPPVAEVTTGVDGMADPSHEGTMSETLPESHGTTMPPQDVPSSSASSGRGKGKSDSRGKSGGREKGSPGKDAAAAAAAAAAALKNENAPVIEEHTDIPLSSAACGLLYNCPPNINVTMNSGAINVRSVPAQEDSLAMMLACGVDDAIGAGSPANAASASSPSGGKGAGGSAGAAGSGAGGAAGGMPPGTGGAKTHILERMEAFDVLWRGSSGEHEVLTWLLQEFLKTMKYKIATAYAQAAGGSPGGAPHGSAADKRKKNGKKR